jgi:two-component system cell cycle sensor histidine kinase/response regulator CckA
MSGNTTPDAQAHSSFTILVVDDEPSLLALVRTMLWRAGFKVLEASGGEEALRVASQHAHPIQLLLTDILMPDMNGYELAEKVKSARPGIQILYMTGYTDKAIFESTGRKLDNSRMIRKPFTAYNLVHRIEEALDGQSLTTQ